VIVVAHRPSALAAADHVLAMLRGAQHAFGPKDDVLARVVRGEPAVRAPLKVVPGISG
jgi:ABC-type protease/lipase transport system fused ATPase/permease subunit